MTLEEVKSAIADVGMGKAAVLDMRRDDEWAEGRATGAIHFEVSRFEKGEMPEISKERPIYTYCAAGGRAEKARQALLAAGYQDVKNLGGFKDWVAAGGPTEIK